MRSNNFEVKVPGDYFRVPNKHTVSNNRTGWDICQKSISEQDLLLPS